MAQVGDAVGLIVGALVVGILVVGNSVKGALVGDSVRSVLEGL